VMAAVGDGPSLVSAIAEHKPDVSIVDVRMPPTHTDEGLRAAVQARGLAQRAAAVDGTLSIDSPPGGPTTITAELPCES